MGTSVRFETNAHPATKHLDFGNTLKEGGDSTFAFLGVSGHRAMRRDISPLFP